MSFVPAPQQASAAVNAVVPSAPAAAAAATPTETSEYEALFKIRTFDVFWVEKYALMYKDGIAKVGYMLLLLNCSLLKDISDTLRNVRGVISNRA